MRLLRRNKRPFWYSNFYVRVPVIDEYGNISGEQHIVYGEPVNGNAFITAEKGESVTEAFGESLEYDKVIVIEDTDITETSVLWVDTTPEFPYDYVVTKVARAMNGVTIAISKVNTSLNGTDIKVSYLYDSLLRPVITSDNNRIIMRG